MSSSAAANGRTRLGRRRARAVASASTGPDPLAAREQRVAHRLLETGGGGLADEAQPVEVVLDPGPQVVRVARRRRARACSQQRQSWPGRAAAVGAAARRGRGGRARLPPRRRAGRTRRRAPPPARARARRSATRRPCARAARQARRCGSSGIDRRACLALAQRRAQDAVDEARRLGAAELLRGLDGLDDRALRRDRRSPSTRSGWSISSSATRMIARSSGAIRASVQPSAWREIRSSSSSGCPRSAWASARVNAPASPSNTSSSARPVSSCW